MKPLYLILGYRNYLLKRGYNTLEEISAMTFSQVQDRFFEVKMQEEMAEEMEDYGVDNYS